ncbi:MAG: UDP-3-O-(3-hydroxymyristoyl)glucosamine N-acyltransferase [Zetaproteobacteria bacterium]|nr:MAG: UDP-3-O-(3-hydroxymyristoyl)glucosamine N-acyltransferase [Zetaproteobacteria bacterium]
MTLAEVARLVDGELIAGDPESSIQGVNTLTDAGPSEASFLANSKYRSQLASSRAGVVLINEKDAQSSKRPMIKVRDPYLAFGLLQRHFHPLPKGRGHVHATAVVHETAKLGEHVDIGAHAVIGSEVAIGDRSIIGAGVVIGHGVRIGRDCIIHANVVIEDGSQLGDRVILQAGAIIGSDGFGYAWTGKEHLKIPQTGRVVLQDDVEIGANTCIDRGALGDTVIEAGVKLDNQIQVGHNVRIGARSIMASQVGISGSTTIGAGCQVGGQVGFAGHIHIAPGVKVAAKSGVASDLGPGTYAGIPAMPHRLWLRVSAVLQRLPALVKQLR